MALMLYGGIALVLVALLVLTFLVLAPGGPKVPIERRLPPGATRETLLSRTATRTVAVFERALQTRKTTALAAELELAGVKMTPASFVLFVSCIAVALGAAGVLVSGMTLWAILLVPFFAMWAPIGSKIALVLRTSRRRAKFAEQVDDAVTLLAGSLRAGHSLMRAVDAASQELDSPMSDELARVVNEARIGRELSDALENVAIRMQNEDLRWVAQAVAINRESGGNLSRVLDQVGTTIRERNQIRRQVKALSAEGRLSAIILVALPIAVGGFLVVVQPTYYLPMVTSLIGIAAMIVAVFLLVVGSIWMFAAVKVKF